MYRTFLPVSIVLVGALAQAASSQDKFPEPAEIRKAVARSLPIIEKASVAWINKRDCMSCHHVTFMLWSHHEAQAHGIDIDVKKLAEWTDWSVQKSLKERSFFKLSSKSVDGLPEPLRPRLKDLIDISYTHEKDFLAALEKALPATEVKAYRAALVKQSALAKKGTVNDGGGLDTMTQLLLGRGRGLDADFLASTADLITRWQEADGTWKAAGQLGSRRWSRPTADQTTTMWTLLALATIEKPASPVSKSIEKGLAAVKKGKPDANHEWLTARMLFERKFGTPEQAAALQKEILGRQNADGAWGCMPGEKSEPFSTGQSMYALRVAGMAPDDANLRRAQKFLLDTQNADGSWNTLPAAISAGNTAERLKKLVPIYSHWGNTWAAIGLARSLPEK